MTLARRTGQRVTSSIWTGFVDAMTGLLLVLTFVLSMFAIVQFVLSGLISSQVDELAARDASIADLRRTVSEGDDERGRLASELARLNEVLGSRDSRITQLEAELEGTVSGLQVATEQSASRQAEIDELSSERDQRLLEIDDLTGQLAELGLRLETAIGRIETLVAERADLTGRLNQSSETNLLLTEERDRMAALLTQANDRTEQLESDIADAHRLEQDRNEEINALRRSLSEVSAEKESESKRILNLLAELEVETASLARETARADSAEAAHLDALKDIAALREALGVATAEIENQEAVILQFTSDVARLEDRVSGLVAANREAEQRNRSIAEELAAARQENAYVVAKADEIADDLIALDLELEEKRKEAEITLTLLAAAEQAKLELGDALADLREEFNAAANQVLTTTSERNEALDAESRLSDDLRQADDALLALRKARMKAEIRLAATNQELERRAKEGADLETELADLRSQLLVAKDEIESHRVRLKAERAARQQLQSHLDGANRQVAELRRKVEQAELRLADTGRSLELGAEARTNLESLLAAREAQYNAALAEIQDYKVRLAESEATVSQLGSELSSANEQTASLRVTVADVQSRLALVERDLQLVNDAKAALELELEERDGRLEQVAAQMGDYRADLAVVQAELDRSSAELTAANEVIVSLRREISDAAAARIHALEDIAALQVALDTATAANQVQGALVLRLTSDIAGLEERVAALVASDREEDEAILALRKARANAAIRLAAANLELERHAAEGSELKAELGDLQSDLKGTVEDIESYRVRLEAEMTTSQQLDAHLGEANQGIANLRREIEQAESRLAEIDRRLDLSEEARTDLASSLADREAQHNSALAEIADHKARLAESEAKGIQLGSELSSANERTASLRLTVADVQSRLAMVERDLQSSNDAKVALELQVAERDQRLEAAADEIESYRLRSTFDHAEADRLTTELSEVGKENVALRQKASDAEVGLAAANRDLEASISLREGLQTELSAERSSHSETVERLERTTADLAAAERKVSGLESAIDAANSTIASLRIELDDHRRQLEVAVKRLETVAGERDELADRLEFRESEHLALQDQVEHLQMRLNAAKDVARQSEESLRAANEDAASLRTKLEASEERLEENRVELGHAADTIAKLESTLEDAETRVLSAEQNARRTGAMLEVITSQLQAAEERNSALRAVTEELEKSLEITRAAQEESAGQVDELNRFLGETKQRVAQLKVRNLTIEEDLQRESNRANESALQLWNIEGTLKQCEKALWEAESEKSDSHLQIATLNQQFGELRKQLQSVQKLFDDENRRHMECETDHKEAIQALRKKLNQALAELAATEKWLLTTLEDLKRLNAERRELEGFRSEFLGRLRKVVEGNEGIMIRGDRFAFASEVLFPSGRARLSEDGKNQISDIADLILGMEDEFPDTIDWVLRVDGHTDDRPIKPGGPYTDNWELSQARSLSVVRFLVSDLNFPENRLAAAGFGEHRPINAEQSEAARTRNRRIEFMLTGP